MGIRRQWLIPRAYTWNTCVLYADGVPFMVVGGKYNNKQTSWINMGYREIFIRRIV